MRLAGELGQDLAWSRIELLSLGTGDSFQPIDPGAVIEWGLAEWAPKLASVLLDGPSKMADYAARVLLEAFQGTYYRLQPEVPPDLSALDAPGAVEELLELACDRLRGETLEVLQHFGRPRGPVRSDISLCAGAAPARSSPGRPPGPRG